jgi:hypothetical protein
VEKFQSLADFLGVQDPRPDEGAALPDAEALVDVSDPKEFCEKVLESREFRQYIMNGITLGDLPPAVMCRIIDHAWGKPVDRVEHTGKDGQPIETIKIVRVVVDPRIDDETVLDLTKSSVH